MEGQLCYPSEGIPPLIISARNLHTGEVFSEKVARNTSRYRLDIPTSGQYVVFAWTDPELFGGPARLGGTYSCYSLFIAQSGRFNPEQGGCVDFEDHEPIVIVIEDSTNIKDVPICDYYSQQHVPPPPD